MNEFEFIQSYLADLSGPESLDLQDDVALWSPPSCFDAVMSLDTLVEGVHFPLGQFDAQLAQKLIRVNISDLVAKGAEPIGYMMSLTLNKEVQDAHLKAFCSGLSKDQRHYGLKLWGGDTTRTSGPDVLSLTIFGKVPKGQIVARFGAKPGDTIYVTGTLGDAALGLKAVLNTLDGNFADADINMWQLAYHVPQPPFSLIKGIRDHANASLDVSDGLIADAGHMAAASKVEITIDLEKIPLSANTAKWVEGQKDPVDALVTLATAGDDYQSLVAVGPDKSRDFQDFAASHGVQLTAIGSVQKGTGVQVRYESGLPLKIDVRGFTHF